MYIGNGGVEVREWGTERYDSEDDRVHLGDREKCVWFEIKKEQKEEEKKIRERNREREIKKAGRFLTRYFYQYFKES